MTLWNEPAEPAAVVRRPRYSHRSRLLAAALRVFVRPAAEFLPIHPAVMRLVDRCAGVAALLARSAVVDPVTVAGVSAEWMRAPSVSAPSRTILHVHGGGFVFGTLAAARDEGLPMPAGMVGLSAWLDLAYRHRRGAPRDAFFAVRFAERAAQRCREADGPLSVAVCPLDIDLRGLPPVLLQAGASEPLCPSNERMARELRDSGVDCRLQLWGEQVHVFQAFAAVLPEARDAFTEIGRFVHAVTPRA